ncbi:hypothetical protein [Hyperthermus butylicus]|uniref:4Fe-4S ferredoxin-type domain-containing protein n=1 Tax=Hyperthermus butylicus (strain DSM 5456 / JCM 9403 / PLM1-5) TaxID=415426 RepID=A2BMK5_HYPBU|nr:hypothetical protein [Hyperthermus butylicus]ABM81216.1 hypothetical protein Hbut_1392 [Hyperthermus butylicus DSM 5456]
MVERSSPGKNSTQVDRSRREFLKAATVAASVSAISFLAVNRDELDRVLVPVKLGDLLAEAEEGESELERRARRKEEELRKWCQAEAEKICGEYGEDSDACREARKRCEMIRVKATGPRKGARYAMALDINKCIGCRRCAYACVMENNQARNLGIEWIRVLELPREGELELLHADMYYAEAPKEGQGLRASSMYALREPAVCHGLPG